MQCVVTGINIEVVCGALSIVKVSKQAKQKSKVINVNWKNVIPSHVGTTAN